MIDSFCDIGYNPIMKTKKTIKHSHSWRDITRPNGLRYALRDTIDRLRYMIGLPVHYDGDGA